jgi:hypothetical protein
MSSPSRNLATEFAKLIIGETLHVDGGYHIMD